MKHKLLFTLGLIVLGWAVVASVPAEAVTQTGAYYATPSWDQTMSANARFIVLSNMSNKAVLDKETGLVWEQSPSTALFHWEDAQNHCNLLTTGNRMGWRLPTLQELASLVDPSKASPALPIGHPFSNVQAHYWSATTTYASSINSAWIVDFSFGVVVDGGKTSNRYAWCVRGGHGVDPQ